MEARNRKLADWYSEIARAEIRLPRFQRFEAWDRQRISSLLQMVVRDLPLGITLILEVGDEEKFLSRFLETAPQKQNVRVHEHLLDGQQRLTALWRAFHNNYTDETYFLYLKEFDKHDEDEDREDLTICHVGRYTKKNGDRYPLWCNEPARCLRRGMIPTDLLRPEDIQVEINQWIEQATEELKPKDDFNALEQFLKMTKAVSDRVRDVRATVANYNLPYLSLPSRTDKSVALDVFIKMNTNAKPLSTYDVIVAEVESAMGTSLHDLVTKLDDRHPLVKRFSQLPELILTTSALLQGKLPNQRGAWDMDKRQLVENWPLVERGLSRMADFLLTEGIVDEQRLPTNAVLAPLAALYARDVSDSGDKRGQDELLLRKYLWHAFFTDRYENAAATHAASDFAALQRVIREQAQADGTPFTPKDVPIFQERVAEVDELLAAEWPKRASIRGRGILAVSDRLGALDFATGERLTSDNIGQRHYHHIFPDALLKEAKIDSFLALNCALIADKTNFTIGRKDPLEYLKDRYKWASELIVRERLQSHLIPIEELANGGYEGLSQAEKVEKLRRDFEAFRLRRAQLILRAMHVLAAGRQLNATEIYAG